MRALFSVNNNLKINF